MVDEAIVLEYDGRFLRCVLMEENKEKLVRSAAHEWEIAGFSEADDPDAETPEGSEDGNPGGGALTLAEALGEAARVFGTREFELALPLSCLLVKVIRLPEEAREDIAEVALSELDGVSPFPGEELSPAVEIFSESETGLVAVAAALPEEPAAELSDALREANVRITRTDVAALGWLRMLWPQICIGNGAAWRLVLLHPGEEWDVLFMQNDAPVAIRGLGRQDDPAALLREITLSLVQTELSDGADPKRGEVVAVAFDPLPEDFAGKLETIAPLRFVAAGDPWNGAEGAALRLEEGTTFDLTPLPWREDLLESRFKSRLKLWASVAAGVWLLLTGGMYGVEMAYDWLAGSQKEQRREKRHSAAYKEVSDMKSRVELIERYTDKSRSALDVLRLVTLCLPESESMVFKSFQYARGESVRVNGTAGAREEVRSFTEQMEAQTFEDGDGEKVFPLVKLSGGETLRKDGTVNYTLEAFFADSSAVAEGKSK